MALSFTSPDVLAVLFAAIGYLLWKLYKFLAIVYTSPLRVLPGPPSPSLVYGNLKQMFATEGTTLPDQWFEQYGKCFVDHEFFMVRVRPPTRGRYAIC